MSQRGSFITEYIWCDKCFKALQGILCVGDKYLDGFVLGDDKLIGSGELHNYPIIAGKIGGSYYGEETIRFEYNLKPQIEKAICHPVRIAVLAENDVTDDEDDAKQHAQIFFCNPINSKEET